MVQLNQPVSSLKGVGSALAKKLQKLGIGTVEELVNHYPRKYRDFSKITPINMLTPGEVTIEGQIKKAITRRTWKRGFTVTEAVVDDATGAVRAVWFNQPYLAKSLPKHTPVFVSGNLDFRYSQYALQNPVVERVSSFTKNTARIIAVYPETEGLSSRQLRNLISQSLPAFKTIPDVLPPSVARTVLAQEPFLHKHEALKQIHFPDSNKQLQAARRYLAFEELFVLVLAALIIKSEVGAEESPRIRFSESVAKEYVGILPFKLTSAQRRAAWQILKDMDSDTAMNRLLEGDVGSGKTVVAAFAAYMAASNGYQAVLMAPTEVLANQHFQTLRSLKVFKKRMQIVTSSIKGKSRRDALDNISSATAKLVIGTHALIEESVKFKNLGLVVIDEQHRFGVNQRNRLKQKADKLPHLLSMTATPIPRSLALTVYGDLDISVLDQQPQGRKPIVTKVATHDERNNIYKHIDAQIEKGKQVYVICPLISESDNLGVRSVENEAERLKQGVFNHRRVGTVHGRMKPSDKDKTMWEFSNGQLDILVSTTVVEVGINVEKATIMLVEGAERFGLASLHQLRGRVGRSRYQSFCYLITTNDMQSQQRLKLMEKYNDGFTLAQKDLEMRGPGELYGKKQHGLLDLRLADLADTKQIDRVRKTAEDFISRDKPHAYPHLMEVVNRLKSMTSLD